METHFDDVKGTILALLLKHLLECVELGDSGNTEKTEHKGNYLLLWYTIVIIVV